ncbi:MAG: UDP-N-acetylmuramoyl-L-alanine--D-glutamate ligase [Labilithrix sp.]|nr:UDP-N-acetylmuramoyl-L-alanine--D-glutamate ligase [Labilithrix sp.]MCW5836714.1 UDP-N-acetylmuramoyl-L-alanine--D-glutamate ligase [Labilithrix sp.]
MLDVKDRRVVVVGLGASGVAACRLLAARGARVVGTDAKPPDAVPAEVRALEENGVSLALGGHGAARLAEADLVVVSPGVPAFPELTDAEGRGVRVWGEVELAVQALSRPAPVVAVGGTNGKSTTTSLVGELLSRAGERVFVGGNLGEPLAAHADEAFDVVVLEVSSFQMERVEAFRPKVGVLLNVSPDHLDRYASEAAYADAKGNAFLRQTEDDVAVVPANDPVCLRQAKRGRARVVTFGEGGDVSVGADAIVDGAASYPRAALALQGGHNALNVAAALAAVRPFGIAPEVVRDVLATFQGLPHRMAFVRERRRVRFYDDSKGTNVGAAVTAVRGIREDKVVLIAGGRDKGGSYGPLVDALRARGRAAVLIGEAAGLLRDAIGDALPVRAAATMDEAVALAAELARPGDAVLLSPACSSFDMFRDYKARGDAFVRAVTELST